MRAPVKYHTRTIQKRFADKVFILEVIRDLDEAIDQVCETLSEEEQQDPFAEDLCPYFGVLWPAAEALTSFLEKNPKLVRGKRVLELGCGLGLPSLVATHLGGEVLATDYHPDVEKFFQRNCRHSSIECDYQRLNWREEGANIGKFDIVMGSDVLYESKHPKEVALGLLRFLSPNGKILLADPGRNYLRPFLEAMEELALLERSESIFVEGKENCLYLFGITEETE